MEGFELGCNWWPRRHAMYLWRRFDEGEARDEMAHLRDVGFETVRVFALAADFLPEPLEPSPTAVDRLVRVARAAKDAGLRSVPTLIVVNMSSALWWAPWMLRDDGSPRDPYEDPLLLRSQARLAEACASALAGDESVRAFDLSNEPDVAFVPRSRHALWCWAALLAGRIRSRAPGVPVQLGCHLPSIATDNGVRIDDVAEVVDEDCMHAYPLYWDGARSPLDPELVPFSCALTADLAGRGRPALMHEAGLCTAPPGAPGHTIEDDFMGTRRPQYVASETEGAEYYRAVLERLARTGAAGFYAWCWADYDPSLFDRPPFDVAVRERSFGIVRADGSEKPAAAVVRDFAARLRRGEIAIGTRPRVLDLEPAEYYADPEGHMRRLYGRWLQSHAPA